MKSVRLIAIVCAVATIGTLVTCQRHNWINGKKQKNDYLLDRQWVYNYSSSPNKVAFKIATYPQGYPRREIIHFINCTDQYVNGRGGFVRVLSGGVGYNHVTLNFTSQRGSGVNFLMEIWGR